MRTYNDQTKNEIEAREIIRKLHNDAGVLWNTLVDYIHHFIDVMQPAHVAKKPGLRAWENVFVKGGKGGDGFFWAEFLEIAKAIKNRMDSPSANDKIEIANNNTTITNISTKKPVRYSLSKFQDTILPIIHKPVLQRKGNVIFEEQLNWNQCLDALLDEKIDVALHNFPTALAFTSNPDSKSDIFFWPFFTFKGYALFLNRKKFKAYCKKNNYEATDFKDLEARHGKKAICDFLNSSKFILERYTDVEYVLKKFVEKQGCVWEDIELNNLLNENINEGKRKFKEDSFGDILCTNSLHVLDLEGRKDKFELIEKGDKLTSHQNFNGLICTMDYYNEHSDLIHELIITWFKCIGDNVCEWELLKSQYKKDDVNNLIYQGLLDHLQRVTYSDKIELDVFIKSYKVNNDFFSDHLFAFEQLFTEMYKSPKAMKRNWDVAQIQKTYPNSKSMEEVFETIRNNMKQVKSKIIS